MCVCEREREMGSVCSCWSVMLHVQGVGFGGDETKCDAVHAVALSSWCAPNSTIAKDVAEMATAAPAAALARA